MAQYPLSTVWTLIYRVNQIKNLIDQLTDHPLVLHDHCVEVQFIGGNLTINKMECRAIQLLADADLLPHWAKYVHVHIHALCA